MSLVLSMSVALKGRRFISYQIMVCTPFTLSSDNNIKFYFQKCLPFLKHFADVHTSTFFFSEIVFSIDKTATSVKPKNFSGQKKAELSSPELKATQNLSDVTVSDGVMTLACYGEGVKQFLLT